LNAFARRHGFAGLDDYAATLARILACQRWIRHSERRTERRQELLASIDNLQGLLDAVAAGAPPLTPEETDYYERHRAAFDAALEGR
jgi:hypothetical protein